jgi:hypothetical protein
MDCLVIGFQQKRATLASRVSSKKLKQTKGVMMIQQ